MKHNFHFTFLSFWQHYDLETDHSHQNGMNM